LVGEVRTRSGRPELILIHVELQARPEPDFPWRFFEYYTLLRRRHRVPVLPIVLYVRGGRGSERWEIYRELVFDAEIVIFRYRRLRLRSLRAMEVAREGNPLACALAALMDRRGADPAELKATSLKGIGSSSLDEARRWELASFVERYLPLQGTAEARYQEFLGQEEYQVAKRLDYETWRRQEREEGALLAMRAAVLSALEERFAPVSEEWRRRVEAIEAPSALDTLLRRVITASDAEEARAALFQASR
jgi:hypothetical protein